MGFISRLGPISLRNSLRSDRTQKILYGAILLVLGAGLIMVTISAPTLMPFFDNVEDLLDPAVSKMTRFLIGAGFITAAMVLFALATETQTTETDTAANPYSSYSYNT